MKKFLLCTFISAFFALSCNDRPAVQEASSTDVYPMGSFGYDLDFLQKHDSMIVLRTDGGRSAVVVSAKYQAKVFTSTADGKRGHSQGWIHYKAFEGPTDAHMNAYGGENRIWLGPEGGKFSLFFSKDSAMSFGNWKTPGALDTAAWSVVRRDTVSVSLRKDMQLVNYAGTVLSISLSRNIMILSRHAIDSVLHLAPDTGLKVVGYRTTNTISNTGNAAWTEKTGMPCLWMLDMFNPSPSTVIVIPYKESGKAGEKPATTDYFGEIPADRIKYADGVLFFKADGKSRGKLGVHPKNAEPMAGSYDAQNKILTLILFDVDSAGRYLNQEWKTGKPPFSGDAVNAYNDGPLADGSQMGPFYELESVSPAAFLLPKGSMSHFHTVIHFTGNEAALDRVSQAWLGVPLSVVRAAF